MLSYQNKTKNLALTGGEATAEAMRQINPGVVPVYPITPQTPIIENFIKYVADGKVDSEVITCESEHSVMSATIGAASSGVRAMTASSSAGLALMYEMLGVASGMRLPIVMNVASRALSSPINIHCDHSDVMGVREAGWIQIFSETAQEAYDHNLLAVKIAENKKVLLPAMVIQDGFSTSHLMEKIELLPDDEVEEFIGKYDYPYSLLKNDKKITFGALVLPDHFFEVKIDQSEAMAEVESVYDEMAQKLSKITNREYPKIEVFQVEKDTEGVIILLGGSAGTAKAVAESLHKKGHKVGVIKVRLFRPFPYEEMFRALGNVANIAVLDRAFSFGSVPPLCTEIMTTLFRFEESGRKVQSYVYGLGGRDLGEKEIEEVAADMLLGKFEEGVKFLGKND